MDFSFDFTASAGIISFFKSYQELSSDDEEVDYEEDEEALLKALRKEIDQEKEERRRLDDEKSYGRNNEEIQNESGNHKLGNTVNETKSGAFHYFFHRQHFQ